MLNSRNQTVDLIRGFAVLLVIAYHALPGIFKSGYIGVDLFFVVSGFVIFKSIKERAGLPLSIWLKGFYYRRLYRIIPALSVALVVGAVLNCLFIPRCGISKDVLATGVAALFGVSNHIISGHEGGYFALNGSLNLFHHTWSLGVEEQFYLFTPCFLMLMSKKYSWKRIGLCLFLVAIISLVYLVLLWLFGKHAYLSTLARVWELLVGMLLYYYISSDCWINRIENLKNRCKYNGCVVWMTRGVLLFITIFSIIDIRDSFPFPLAIIPVICACILLFFSFYFDGYIFSTRGGFYRILQHLGVISYSWYLYHYLFIVLLSWTFGLDGLVKIMVFLIVSYFFALMSFRFIENPLIAYARKTETHMNWWIPLWCIVFSGASLIISFYWSRSITVSVTGRNAFDWYQPKLTNKVFYSGKEGARYSRRKLFVFGDSHAYSYRAMFNELREFGVSFYLDERGARGITLINPLDEKAILEFSEFFSVVKMNGQPGDLVFLPSLKVPRYCDYWYTQAKSSFTNQNCYKDVAAHRIAIEQCVSIIGKFSEIGILVVIDGPKPVLPAPPFRVSDWFNKMNPIGMNGVNINSADLKKHKDEVLFAIDEIKKRCPNLLVFEPYATLCPNSDCCAFEDGHPLFFDGDHLSNYGAKKCTPSFMSKLDEAWLNNR
jgi:peptidoglycan/LPS O-acetylase OafA/YrhL